VDATTIFADPVMLTARWHNLAIIDYRGPWQLAHIDEIARLYREIFASYERAVGVTVAHPGTRMSSPGVNSKAAALMKGLRDQVVASVIVVEERGAMAAMWRGVIRTVNILAGHANIQVATSLDEVARHLLPHVQALDGRPVSELQLTGAIRRACSATTPAQGGAQQ
jgi:hypothetical protein